MRKLILIFFVLINFSGFSQKTVRACNALEDLKYDKALELFSEVIEKNPTEVPALVGYAKTIIQIITTSSAISNDAAKKASKSVIEMSVLQLITAEQNYVSADNNDKELLSKRLAINNIDDIFSLKIKLSEYLWKNFYVVLNEINAIEIFISKFSFGNEQLRQAERKLSSLYFQQAKIQNTIGSYQLFLEKFPNSRETSDALQQIENIEVESAISTPQIDTLKKLIQKYPDNSKIDIMQEKLARLYVNSIDENTKPSVITKVIRKINNLNRINRSTYIEECNLIYTKSMINELLKSNDLSIIMPFLKSSAKYTSIDFEPLRRHRNQLITNDLLEKAEINYALFLLLMKEETMENPKSLEILNKASSDLKNKCTQCYKDLLNGYYNNEIPVSYNFKDPLMEVILQNINLSFNSISSDYLFNACKSININNNTMPIRDLVTSLGVFETLIAEDLYISQVNNSWDIISLIKTNKEGKVKRQNYVYNFMNAYELVPEIKLNAPIYTAIKQRYSIVQFSAPKIYRKNDNGFQILLYGYTSSNQTCCPGYEININYKYENGVLLPLLANYVNPYYSTIPQDNLENYYKISNAIFTSGYENCLLKFDRQNLSMNDNNQRPFISKQIIADENDPSEIKAIEMPVDDSQIFSRVEVEAQFPGGENNWNKYVYNTIMRSIDDLVEDGKAGTVEVQFIVDKEGNVSNVEALNMKGTVVARVATDAIKKGPRWVPAKQNGRPVKAWRRQKLTFRLPDE
jgi:hypothetical protein